MSQLFEAIESHAGFRGTCTAIRSQSLQISYGSLSRQMYRLAERIAMTGPKVVGILADNSPNWVLADLATMLAVVPVVPLPNFFSPSQLKQAIEQAGIDFLLTDRPPGRLPNISVEPARGWRSEGEIACYCVDRREGAALPLPPGTGKVTFTSGSTGTPKGVCLSLGSMEQVALSLLNATAAGRNDRHLCVSPLATLLENIAGVYVPLMAGATCMVPSLPEVGLNGSSRLDIMAQLSMMEELEATTAVIVPQMLAAQVAALEKGTPRPSRLRYLAVGGGAVSSKLLERATSVGLPVFQGYGLSECGSVVALNTAEHNRLGSVGKPLAHVRVTIEEDREVVVHGSHFLGYLGDARSSRQTAFATGDCGAFDEDGYLHIVGRRKNVFITSFGRNVSPEWVEREFLVTSCLQQIAVFGEARPYNIAVIVPRVEASAEAIRDAMASVNSTLPDYARVKRWIVAREPFMPANGQLSHNGRQKRSEIQAAYARELDGIWTSSAAQ